MWTKNKNKNKIMWTIVKSTMHINNIMWTKNKIKNKIMSIVKSTMHINNIMWTKNKIKNKIMSIVKSTMHQNINKLNIVAFWNVVPVFINNSEVTTTVVAVVAGVFCYFMYNKFSNWYNPPVAKPIDLSNYYLNLAESPLSSFNEVEQVTLENIIPNIVENVVPNIIPNVVENVVPNVVPNIIPNVVENVVPNIVDISFTKIDEIFTNLVNINKLFSATFDGTRLINIKQRIVNIEADYSKYGSILRGVHNDLIHDFKLINKKYLDNTMDYYSSSNMNEVELHFFKLTMNMMNDLMTEQTKILVDELNKIQIHLISNLENLSNSQILNENNLMGSYNQFINKSKININKYEKLTQQLNEELSSFKDKFSNVNCIDKSDFNNLIFSDTSHKMQELIDECNKLQKLLSESNNLIENFKEQLKQKDFQIDNLNNLLIESQNSINKLNSEIQLNEENMQNLESKFSDSENIINNLKFQLNVEKTCRSDLIEYLNNAKKFESDEFKFFAKKTKKLVKTNYEENYDYFSNHMPKSSKPDSFVPCRILNEHDIEKILNRTEKSDFCIIIDIISSWNPWE